MLPDNDTDHCQVLMPLFAAPTHTHSHKLTHAHTYPKGRGGCDETIMYEITLSTEEMFLRKLTTIRRVFFCKVEKRYEEKLECVQQAVK